MRKCVLAALALASFVLPASAAEKRPFPQHQTYAAGSILPSIPAAERDVDVAGFYDQWKAHYLKEMCGAGRYVVDISDEGTGFLTVSEAHGYGMLITVFMAGHDPDAQKLFDGLYWFFREHHAASSPYLLAWRQTTNCKDDGTDTATDGDLDIAQSLLLADKQWGSGGPIDYRAEALKVIAAIEAHEIAPKSFHILMGDWASLDQPAQYYGTRTSDFLMSHFRSFAAATGGDTWPKVIERCYGLIEVMQSTYSKRTGLLPDFISHLDGKPRPAKPHFMEEANDGGLSFNAARDPWRIGLDFLLTGEPRAKIAVDRLTHFLKTKTGGDPAKLRAGYKLNGTPTVGYSDMVFTAPLGVGAMLSADNQAFLDAIWKETVAQPIKEGKYFSNTLKMLALIAMSGNWWAP